MANKWKAQLRLRRQRDAMNTAPGLLLIAFFAGLYFGNPLAKEVAQVMLDNWNWIFLAISTTLIAFTTKRRK